MINENDNFKLDIDLISILLKDNSSKKNIIWAIDDYKYLGEDFQAHQQIKIEHTTGENEHLIKSRVLKTKTLQKSRSKEKAEVFTPSWVCNAQNNLVDNEWFGKKNVFNIEGDNGWISTTNHIEFPKGKNWKDYIRDIRMEITCGEAPYIVSRYDTCTGELIKVKNRIGLLDRKLRIVSENTTTNDEWLYWAKNAVQSIYGFDWQGDNLFIARKNILYTFIEHYNEKFNCFLDKDVMIEIAEIISWNIWQMDGLKGVIPNSCGEKKIFSKNLLEEEVVDIQKCIGCEKNNIHNHNGIYCKIKDWQTGEIFNFISLIKK
jgi:hypothetical protein